MEALPTALSLSRNDTKSIAQFANLFYRNISRIGMWKACVV